jgi:hypothetical protein
VDPDDDAILVPEAALDASDRPRCFICSRPTFDPDKRERPWARAAVGGHQALICPRCQEERPDWVVQLDRCERCGATRLSVVLGEVVCRECGHVRGAEVGSRT